MKIINVVYSFILWLANLGTCYGWPKGHICMMIIVYSFVLVYLMKVYYLIYFV